LTFTADEAVALVMSALDGHHDVTDPAASVSTALAKIMRGLPEAIAASAEALRRSAAPAPDRAAIRADPNIATSLIKAVEMRSPTRIEYRSESGSQSSLDVEPWGVVVRHGRWYLLCRSIRADATRAYRVDRVVDIAPLPGSFVPPRKLDPVQALEEHLASGWDYEVEVIIDAPLENLGRQVPRALGRLERIDDAMTRLRGSTSNPTWYVEQLVCIRSPFRIEGCDEIRAAAADVGHRLLEAVDDPASHSRSEETTPSR
jgi:predicted DNA-binding transcriptional regulator YafY